MCTHLTRRGAAYYFRRVIPQELRPRFAGKREWTYSLGTKDRGAAKRLAQAETVRTNGLIDQVLGVSTDVPCPVQSPELPAALLEPPRPESRIMLDKEIVDLWAAERKVQPQGVQMYRAAARWLYERIGRKPVDQITKPDILAFKAKLVAEGCTAANIKNKLSRLRTLLQWAADNGYAASNAADGVSIKDGEAAKNKRRSFDLASLNAIFSSPIYAKSERPSDSRSAGDAAYWLPLLALFTGARREELGQLRPDDVVRLSYPAPDGQPQSAWFLKLIEVDDEGTATVLKNAASERLVPVHPELERLGFVRFALAMKEQGRTRIFHALKPSKFGRLTDKWGQWFTIYRRDVCGVTDRRMVFHSFRHTFKDYARHAGIVEAVQREIMGHSGDDVADDYGSGHSLYRLVEGMSLYKVSGLTLLA